MANWIDNASNYTRNGARRAANFVEAGVTPMNIAMDTAVKLADVAHTSVTKLIERQRDIMVGTVEAGAKRLKVAADSKNVRGLIEGQVALLPESRERIVEDLRETWEVVLEARDGVRGAFQRPNGVKKAAQTAKKATAKTASTVKKTVKKAAS